MKISSLILITFYAFIFSPLINAQDTHVHTRSVKDSKTTIVETDLMYLINTPQQFMQLGLVARYPNERLDKPPKKIDLIIWSFSREAMYRESKGPALKVNTDGEAWSVSPQAYLVFKGETKNGQDIFWGEKRPDLGQPSPLPETTLVRAGEGITGLFMEQVFFELKPDQLIKIAGAKKVELQMGMTRLEFTEAHMNTIRDFNSRLAPGTAQPPTDMNATQAAPASKRKSVEPIDIGVVNGKAISLPRPEYPSMARAARAAGTVNVLVTIDEMGKVIAARAISGHPLLRDAAEAAAKEARFKPTIFSGQPVKVTGIIFYNFVAQ
jgi:TonB family protein